MKILYDHQIFSKERYGGVARYYYELVKQFKNMDGVDVEIFAPLYNSEYLASNKSLHPAGVKLPLSGKVAQLLAWGFNSALSTVTLKPRRGVDIFHETYYYGTGVCPKYSKRVITVFDMIHEKLDNVSKNQDRACKNKAKAVARADHIICISKNTQRDLIEVLNVPEDKTSVVYLGYSLIEGTREQNVVNYDRPYLLYVGQRGGYKNFERLLKAFSNSDLLKDNYYLVCFGGAELDDRELALIKSLRIDIDSIKYTTGSDSVLTSLYSGAALFVYPSMYEGFGIPLLEAMVHGSPVVCSNTSSLPEVAGDAAQYFDPQSEEDMQQVIEKVLRSPEISNELVKKGKERIKNYSWEKCAYDTLAIYKNLIQG